MSRIAAWAAAFFFGLVACTASASEKRHALGPKSCFGSPLPGEWTISRKFHDPKYEYRKIIEHTGIDIPADVGTDVYAPVGGTIIAAGADAQDNNMVVVRVSKRVRYRVMHLSAIMVEKGQVVKRGDVLGLSGGEVGAKGSGPMTTGPHLHLDVDLDGRFIDPAPLLCPDAGPTPRK